MKLKTALGNYHHVAALRSGNVGKDGIELEFVQDVPLTEAFRRMARDDAYDICEMPLTTLAIALDKSRPLTGLPLPVLRGFHHDAIVCLRDSPLDHPGALAGRRVAVRAYSQTTGVWVRGILEAEYGLNPDDVTWVTLEGSHVAEYRDPNNVEMAAPGSNLRDMLLSGEVDAVVGLMSVDGALMRPLVPDAGDAIAEWYGRTGIFPANHVVAIHNRLVDADPELPRTLYRLFADAKARSGEGTHAVQVKAGEPAADGVLGNPHHRRLIDGDHLPYGFHRNRDAFRMILDYSQKQKLTTRTLAPEELFHASTIEN